ncbi:MAG: hypothetical protein ACMG51_06820 [Ginsengibacter sp.]
MTRLTLIRRLIRDVFGSQPMNDTNLTDNFVNVFINEGIAIAIKQNWKESIQLDGIAYVNDSYISSYKGLTVTKDEDFIYKVTLPSIPTALGRNEGFQSLRFKAVDGKVSNDCVILNSSQIPFMNYREIPNRILAYYEGGNVFAQSTLPLNTYTAQVRMISAGDTDLNGELNIPDDALSIVTGYVSTILIRERQVRKDDSNDGIDN